MFTELREENKNLSRENAALMERMAKAMEAIVSLEEDKKEYKAAVVEYENGIQEYKEELKRDYLNWAKAFCGLVTGEKNYLNPFGNISLNAIIEDVRDGCQRKDSTVVRLENLRDAILSVVELGD